MSDVLPSFFLAAMMVVSRVAIELTCQIRCTVNTHCTLTIHTSSMKNVKVKYLIIVILITREVVIFQVQC